VDADGALVTGPVRLYIDVKIAPGQPPPHQFDAADLDHPMAIGDRHTGGFGVEYYGTNGHGQKTLEQGERRSRWSDGHERQPVKL